MRQWMALLGVLVGCDRVFELERPIDARPVQPFDAELGCPEIYKLSFAGISSSRYYILLGGDSFPNQRSICRSHGIGTHLVKLDDVAEAQALFAHMKTETLPDPANPWVWIGLLQAPTAATPEADWTWIVGGDVAPDLWDVSDPADPEPDDDDRDELTTGTNQDHGTLYLPAVDGFLHDRSGNRPLAAICECDGLPEL